MKVLGITEAGFLRLAQLCRPHVVIGQSVLVEEDGEEEEEEVAGLDYGKFNEEEFTRGTMIMGLLGYELEALEHSEKVEILEQHPDYLKLVPRLEISGQWVHALRETDLDDSDLQEVIESIRDSDSEICVTDANEKEFWYFSEDRRFGLVFEGTCRILWNADMYSALDDWGYLHGVDADPTYIDQMTEGWIKPASSHLVSLRVREDDRLPEDMDKLQELVANLGISWDQGEQVQKQLVGVEIIDAEEAQDYYDRPYDSIEEMSKSDNPEILYEPIDSSGETYQQTVNTALISGAQHQSIEEVKQALWNGADSQAKGKALVAAVDTGNLSIVELLLNSGADVNYREGALFRGPVVQNPNADMLLLLLQHGLGESKEALQYYFKISLLNEDFDLAKIMLYYGASIEGLSKFDLSRMSFKARKFLKEWQI